MNTKKLILISTVLALAAADIAFAAIGCTLTDPDRDIKRMFPSSSSYKTEFLTIRENGGSKLAAEIEKKLGDKLDPVFEANDVPYTYYTVLDKTNPIGYVHGVNQKGTFGTMQIVLAIDPNGVIKSFYYQKLSSPEAKKFRDPEFAKSFVGLTLADFYEFSKNNKGPVANIKDPSEKNHEDFLATLRGVKKNLILTDILKLNRRSEKVNHEKDEKK